MERHRRHIPAGQKLLVEGEQGSCAYLIESGELEVITGLADNKIGCVAAGELVGEMALLANRPVSATVRATTDCQVIEIPRDAFDQRVSEADPLLRIVVRDMVHRVHGLLERLPRTTGSHAAVPAADFADTGIRSLRAEVLQSVLMEGALAQALNNNELTVALQPIVSAATGVLAGFEALVRWPRGNVVMQPDEFIALAEQTGLIRPLGRQVLAEACRALATLKTKLALRPGSLFVAVNVSTRQFDDPELLNMVGEIVDGNRLVPGELKLEVTESAVMQNPEASIKRLKEFRDLGVRVAVDDFGTGYSSLVYLAQLPVQGLKIDQYFVREMFSNPQAMTIIRAIVSLAKDLGLQTVAEGVETYAQRDALRNLGIEQLQGYLYSRPLPLDEMIEWYTSGAKH